MFGNFRYADFEKDETTNGKNVGATLFVQYCSHKCKNCHNHSTWNKSGGKQFNESDLKEIMNYFNDKKYATRLTISGGDPLDNLKFTNTVCSEFKRNFKDHKLWLYTGYNFEYILQNEKMFEIVKYCDVIVDGLYVDELRDVTLKFRGSSNQRVIDVQKSLKQNKIILYCD